MDEKDIEEWEILLRDEVSKIEKYNIEGLIISILSFFNSSTNSRSLEVFVSSVDIVAAIKSSL